MCSARCAHKRFMSDIQPKEVNFVKRIIFACLEQTNRFDNSEDFDLYKSALENKKTPYKILDVKTDADGSVVVKMKLQYNTYAVGDYLN